MGKKRQILGPYRTSLLKKWTTKLKVRKNSKLKSWITFSKAEVSAQVVNLLRLSKNLRFDAYLDLPVAIVMAKNDAKNPNQLSKVPNRQEQFLKLE